MPVPIRRFVSRSLRRATQKVPHQPAVPHRPGQRQHESSPGRSDLLRETDDPAEGLRQVERAHRPLLASPVEVDLLVDRSPASDGQTEIGQTGAGQTGAGQTGAGQTGAGQTGAGQTGAEALSGYRRSDGR